jgi:ABC-type transporter Mla maintaining outer membrane lipid asymmetry ATPase subunit MlaF
MNSPPTAPDAAIGEALPLVCTGVSWRPPTFPGPLLAGLDLRLAAGATAAITGAPGSGCTVVADLILGALTPDEGEIVLLGERPAELGDDDLAQLRGRVGFVPAQGALLGNLSLADNIALPAAWHAPCTDPGSAVADVLAALGIANLPRVRPADAAPELRALAALARALIRWPPLLILDSLGRDLPPTAAADLWRRLDRARHGCAILSVGAVPPWVTDQEVLHLPPRPLVAGLRRVTTR